MRLYQFAFLVIFLTVGECSNKGPSKSAQLKVDKCGGDAWTPNAVSILPCTSPPCHFALNADYTIDMSFRPPIDSKEFMSEIRLLSDGRAPQTLLMDQMCNKLRDGDSCPLRQWSNYHVLDELYVEEEKYVSDKPVTLQYRLLGDNNKIISCFQIQAYIDPESE